VRDDTLPPPRSWGDRNPDADARLKAARPALAAIAEEWQLPLENLLTPDHLRRLAWSPPADPDAKGIAERLVELGARAWQIDATAQLIAQAFVEAHQTAAEAPPPDS
jgi:ribonuclease D